MVEKCIKLNTKNNQINKNKEILKITPEQLKKIIDNCYCKYASSEENCELYDELSQLSGLYSYVKDKVNIKPYILIDDEK